MEKNEITLSFDSERMDALAFYLTKENSTVQKKMDEALRQLYEQTVPEPVREYLDAKNAPAARPKRPSRSSQSGAGTLKQPPASTSDQEKGGA